MNFSHPLFWKALLPRFRLHGRGSRDFLQGQTTAEIIHPEKNDEYLRTCWLSPTGRLKALLEVRFIGQDAEVTLLGGNSQNLLKGFDQVNFPSDQVELQSIGDIQRVQEISYKRPWSKCQVEWLLPSESISSAFDGSQSASENQVEEWRIRQGLPIGIGIFIELSMFSGAAIILSVLGEVVVASHTVAINIASLFFITLFIS